MSDVTKLLVDHLDVWTGAMERRNSAGRGGGGKLSLYGIEKLRSLILDLAVRGKLVRQDLSDESALQLQKRLRTLAKSTSFKSLVSKYAQEANPRRDEVPFAVPDGWQWVRVAHLGHNWGQTEPDSEFTYIDVGAIDQAAGRVVDPQTLRAAEAPSRARKVVREGTVIYSTVRPYLLNIAVIDQAFDPAPIASTAFAVVHPFEGVDRRFLFWAFRSPYFIGYVERCQTGIAYPAINDKQFFCAPFPLPPEAEQARIVAKVDELMALCDALEAGTLEAMAAHEKLVRELLATLVNSQDAADLDANWSRIETHFDELFTTEESVAALEQTVVSLGTGGRFQQITTRTNLAPLPSDWRWTTISELEPEFQNGVSSRGMKEGKPVVVLRLADITDNQVDLSGVRQLRMDADTVEKYAVAAGDFLIIRVNGSANLVGRFIYCPSSLDAVYCDHFIRMRRLPEYIDPQYLAVVAGSRSVRDQIEKLFVSTAGQKTVNQKHIGSVKFPLPPIDEQRRIVLKVGRFVALCRSLRDAFPEANDFATRLSDVLTATVR